MSEEEIRCCINIATLGKELPYKKLLKKMKKEHLVDVCYELLKEHLALLDIKEYIEDEVLKYHTFCNSDDTKIVLDIVNKSLGSDSNDE